MSRADRFADLFAELDLMNVDEHTSALANNLTRTLVLLAETTGELASAFVKINELEARIQALENTDER